MSLHHPSCPRPKRHPDSTFSPQSFIFRRKILLIICDFHLFTFRIPAWDHTLSMLPPRATRNTRLALTHFFLSDKQASLPQLLVPFRGVVSITKVSLPFASKPEPPHVEPFHKKHNPAPPRCPDDHRFLDLFSVGACPPKRLKHRFRSQLLDLLHKLIHHHSQGTTSSLINQTLSAHAMPLSL